MKNSVLLFLAFTMICASAVHGASPYEITLLPSAPTATLSIASGISLSKVAGYRYLGDFNQLTGIYQPTLWNGIQSQSLPVPAGSQGRATQLNASGSVIGSIRALNSYDPQPVNWQNGQLKLLDTLGMPAGAATGINNTGSIAGTVYGVDSGSHAVIWNGSQTTILGSFTSALAINNARPEKGSNKLCRKPQLLSYIFAWTLL